MTKKYTDEELNKFEDQVCDVIEQALDLAKGDNGRAIAILVMAAGTTLGVSSTTTEEATGMFLKAFAIGHQHREKTSNDQN